MSKKGKQQEAQEPQVVVVEEKAADDQTVPHGTPGSPVDVGRYVTNSMVAKDNVFFVEPGLFAIRPDQEEPFLGVISSRFQVIKEGNRRDREYAQKVLIESVKKQKREMYDLVGLTEASIQSHFRQLEEGARIVYERDQRDRRIKVKAREWEKFDDENLPGAGVPCHACGYDAQDKKQRFACRLAEEHGTKEIKEEAGRRMKERQEWLLSVLKEPKKSKQSKA